MFDQDDDSQQGFILAFVLGVVALVVASVIGVGIYQLGKAARPEAGAPVAAAVTATTAAPIEAPIPAPAPGGAAQAAQDAASVKVENGVVKFYFASGKADLAQGAPDALADVIKGAKAGRKLVISGYHDATGSAAKNAELAKLRAFAVRDALVAAGVSEAAMELKKPEQMTASGSDAEARRVEVTLQ